MTTTGNNKNNSLFACGSSIRPTVSSIRQPKLDHASLSRLIHVCTYPIIVPAPPLAPTPPAISHCRPILSLDCITFIHLDSSVFIAAFTTLSLHTLFTPFHASNSYAPLVHFRFRLELAATSSLLAHSTALCIGTAKPNKSKLILIAHTTFFLPLKPQLRIRRPSNLRINIRTNLHLPFTIANNIPYRRNLRLLIISISLSTIIETPGHESMRNWLLARTEEEKTRQEEEKTRQEGLRLEQRKIEMDMLRSSLSGGIPPPMIPLVFTGMASGGILPQTALDWAHQFMVSQQQQYPQLPPPPPRPLSPESQREAAAQPPAQYHPPPNLPPPHGGAYAAYATSPTRARGQTVSTVARPAAGSNISSAGSNTPQSGGLQPSTSTLGPFQPQQSSGGQPTQHDSTLYFHHWLPPATQSGQSSGASNRPSSPAGESQKKRKAAADPSHHSRTSRAPGRKSHKRHKSDVSWHHAPRHAIGASHDSRHRARTPAQDNSSTSSKDREVAEGKTYARPRQEDEGQNRDREREREASAAPGERAA
ncbi:hypothetical protein CCM_09211 [Cordyceps militaris CM01]|uniref:Uncharacterized protein n=1 Tax=Cordyceps militaris (strain CM01) TaxID=983644 RepID=G3JTS1_CORMM|nr:uncharacterized protein CCM_09211 [Cordyceps militaris CM01]EGX88075.1 hypothetical protein CCM_09211 [Cordyceps militaris CM01]